MHGRTHPSERNEITLDEGATAGAHTLAKHNLHGEPQPNSLRQIPLGPAKRKKRWTTGYIDDHVHVAFLSRLAACDGSDDTDYADAIALLDLIALVAERFKHTTPVDRHARSLRLYIASMRWVTRKPPKMFTLASIK